MGQDLLVTEQIDAGADFVRDFNQYVNVSAACWVSPADTENLFLYIASDDIDDSNIVAAYGEVLRILRGNGNFGLDPFQVKLVNTSDAVARDAVQLRDRFPARIPTRFQGSSFGGISVNPPVYIYPRISTLTAAP